MFRLHGHIELRPLFEAPAITDNEEAIRKENGLKAQVEAYKKY